MTLHICNDIICRAISGVKSVSSFCFFFRFFENINQLHYRLFRFELFLSGTGYSHDLALPNPVRVRLLGRGENSKLEIRNTL